MYQLGNKTKDHENQIINDGNITFFPTQKVVKITTAHTFLANYDHFVSHDFLLHFVHVMKLIKISNFTCKIFFSLKITKFYDIITIDLEIPKSCRSQSH